MKTKQPGSSLLVVESSLTVTRKMVRERAVELAVRHGRSSMAASGEDWEQAKRQLNGQPEPEPIFEGPALESIPAAEGWDPAPPTPGHQLSEPPSEDEDEEGRSNSERLVEKGIENAEEEQMNQAEKAQPKE